MKTDIDYVEANKFPRDLRDTVNDLVERDRRTEEIRVSDGFETVGHIEESDDKKVYVLPRSGGIFSMGGTPYFVYIKTFPDGTKKRGVFIYSTSALTTDSSNANQTTPTGLLTKLQPTNTDTGWIATSTTDRVWILYSFDTAHWPKLITTGGCRIASIGNGDVFKTGSEAEYVDQSGTGAGPFVQSFARVPICNMGADANNNPFPQWVLLNRNPFLLNVTMTANDSSGGNARNIRCLYPTI